MDNLGIDHDPHSEREFLDSFKETGNVHIAETTKDGSIIVLTQKGQDNLHAPAEKPVQPNIHIQDNPNSIINIGGSQSGSFDSGIKKDTAVINKTPSENPSNKNKPASPTKTWQIIGVIVSEIGILFFFILFSYFVANFAKFLSVRKTANPILVIFAKHNSMQFYAV